MIKPQTKKEAADHASIFGLQPEALPQNSFSEMFATSDNLRAHWQPLVTAFEAMGPSLLKDKQARAGRMRHEDGATFNPFDDPSGRGTPWALELFPYVLTAEEWGLIERGLTQRARLLATILADVYGAQQLVKDGRIPAEMVFNNPRFHLPCHGIKPSRLGFLPFYVVDLYRDTNGNFRIFRDYGSNPAGLGYALENRIIISRIFQELYHQTRIRRLAPFFHTLQQTLIESAATKRLDPNIVLLSPGSDSHIYFEQAFLSRYLNFQLVESQDLTVRNGKVYLKKLAGLEPVEAIFRHLEDHDCDPFALRRNTGIGVAGLIQVMREGTIDLVNPVGSGFIETPVLPLFLPELARQLLGEELLLAGHPSWWAGDIEGRERILAEPSRFVMQKAINSDLQFRNESWPEAFEVAPAMWLASEKLNPSYTPFLENGTAVHRPVLLRFFVCAVNDGFAVMPGGLAITAPDVASLTDNVLERQQSKDIWILSDQPVEYFSLMQGLQHVGEFRRGGDLPSRVADNLLWLGRYLERAEGLSRILRSIYRRLSSETKARDIQELPYLFRLLERHNPLCPIFAESGELLGIRQLENSLARALFNERDQGSVVTILKRVLNTARNVRDRLSLDSWRVVDRFETFGESKDAEPLSLLADTLFGLSSFSGLAMESMTRGLGWLFLDMGRRLERAIFQTGIMTTGLAQVDVQAYYILESMLEISDSIMTYRGRYRTAFQLAPVLDLLLMDETNPKSLAFQFSCLAGHVDQLPRQTDRRFATVEERLALEMLTSIRLLDLTHLFQKENSSGLDDILNLLTNIDSSLVSFAQQITAHYLSRVPATPHFSVIGPDNSV
jgi:uncharacterized circularly permuted ATP-grasp superfamily protein/uncharacterized alpha-E superfamily protein